jgi:hypothetical protein
VCRCFQLPYSTIPNIDPSVAAIRPHYAANDIVRLNQPNFALSVVVTPGMDAGRTHIHDSAYPGMIDTSVETNQVTAANGGNIAGLYSRNVPISQTGGHRVVLVNYKQVLPVLHATPFSSFP